MIQILTIGLFAGMCLGGILNANYCLVLLVSMFAIEQGLQASSPMFASQPILCNLIITGVTAIAVFRTFLKNNSINYIFNSGFIIFVCIYGWSVLSLMWTPSFEIASKIIGIGIIYIILYGFLAQILIGDKDFIYKFNLILMGCGAIICTLVLLNPEFIFRDGRLVFQLTHDIRTNPNAVGELGATIFVVAVLLRISKVHWFVQLLRFVAFFSGILMAFQSGSRGQLGFAIFVCLILYPVAKIVQFKNLIGALIGIVFSIPIIYLIASQFVGQDVLIRWSTGTGGGGIDSGIYVRLLNSLDLISEWVTRPIAWVIGLGVNAFSSLTTAGSVEGYAHNLTIEIMTELGLPIFFLYLIFIIKTAHSAYALFDRYRQQPHERANITTLIGCWVFQLLLAQKQGNLWTDVSFFFYSLWIIGLQYKTLNSDNLLYGFETNQSMKQDLYSDTRSADDKNYQS